MSAVTERPHEGSRTGRNIARAFLLSAYLMGLGPSGCTVKPQFTRPPTPFAGVVGPVVIAHRGGSLEAPENTVASVQHGVAVGADWQEIDVTLSRDGEVVVIHDDTLDRTARVPGEVEKLTFEALRRVDVGNPSWADYVLERLHGLGVTPPDFGERFKNERIPTLAEILRIPEARLMIELKATPRVRELATEVVEAVHRANAHGRVALGSFDVALLEAVSARDSTIPLIGIAEDLAGVDRMLGLPITVLAVHTSLAEPSLYKAPAGVAVWTWTVYTGDEAQQLAELGVHGVITDAPTSVLATLRPSDDSLTIPR